MAVVTFCEVEHWCARGSPWSRSCKPPAPHLRRVIDFHVGPDQAVKIQDIHDQPDEDRRKNAIRSRHSVVTRAICARHGSVSPEGVGRRGALG